MPRGRPRNIMPLEENNLDESQSPSRLDILDAKMEAITEMMGKIVSGLEDKKKTQRTPLVVEHKKPVEDEFEDISVSWRKILDEELGPEFRATRKETTGGWQMLVYFPEKYDTRIGRVDSIQKEDIHSASPIRAISSKEDVRFWCKKFAEYIRKTVDPSFKLNLANQITRQEV